MDYFKKNTYFAHFVLPLTFFLNGNYFYTSLYLIAVTSYYITKYLVDILPRLNFIDIPNNRSNHTVPTPRGGGISIVIAVSLGLLIASSFYQSENSIFFYYIIPPLLVLSFISLMDDYKCVSPLIRLFVHFFVSWLIIYKLPSEWLIFQGLVPKNVDIFLGTILLAGFINLYNFMDGIDEISANQTIAISLLILLSSLFLKIYDQNFITSFINPYVFVLATSIFGFMIWNRHPAKIFLGDIGSTSIGFLVGFILIVFAAKLKAWAAAIIIPSYYFADAGVILLLRIIACKKIWEAHSDHFYQVAAKNLGNHNMVAKRITIINLGLVPITVLSMYYPFTAIFICAIYHAYMIRFYLLKLTSDDSLEDIELPQS